MTMTLFSKLKGAKKAAAEHKAAEAAAAKIEGPEAPYKHRPRHAAQDMLTGSPTSWKAYDQAAIKDAHRKRMSANVSMSGYSSTNRASRSNLAAARYTRDSSATGTPTASGTPAGPSRVPSTVGSGSVRPSPRHSVSFGPAPRSQHLGYATYAGYEASQQLHAQQTQFGMSGGAPQRRVRSYHGKSPLGSELQPSLAHSARSSRSSAAEGLEIAPLPPAKTVSFSAPQAVEPATPQVPPRAPGPRAGAKRRSAEAALGGHSKPPSPTASSPFRAASPLLEEVAVPDPADVTRALAATAPAAAKSPAATAKTAPVVSVRPLDHSRQGSEEDVPLAKAKSEPAASRPAKKKRWLFRFGSKNPVAVAAH